MRDAVLWKRLVLSNDVANAEEIWPQLYHNLIRATQLVDTRPRVEAEDNGTPIDWPRYAGITVPFPLFWIEGLTDQGLVFGGLLVTREADGIPLPLGSDRPPDASHATVIHALFDTPSRRGPSYLGGNIIWMDKNTQPVIRNNDIVMTTGIPRMIANKEVALRASQMLQRITASVLDTLMVLSCKNVALSPRRQTDTAAVREATRRNGGHPAGYRYHVLVVRPPGARSDAPPQDIGNMPRHICRGHFSEYGPEFGKGLLFGKYAGRFYVPPHIKGDAKNGIVEKDYAVADRAG